MKKIIVFLISFCFLAMMGAGIALEPEEPLTTTISVNFSRPVITLEEGEMIVEVAETDTVLASQYYQQPSLKKQFIYPFSTTITSITANPVNVISEPLQALPRLSPEPIQLSTGRSVFDGMGQELPRAVDEWVNARVGSGIIDGIRYTILTLYIQPVLYDIDHQIVKSASDIEIEISYEQPTKTLTADTYELLILSTDELSSSLSPLVTHKESRGISTKLVTLSDVSSGSYFPVQGRDIQENMKYFIKNAIEQWGITAVLLVGDGYNLPSRETHIRVSGSDQEIFVSDLYFADVYNETGAFSSWDTNENDIFAEFNWGSPPAKDDLDLFPDVYIGRLACVNTAEVDAIIQKIIGYETDSAYTSEWFTNLIVVGGDSFTNNIGDDSGVNEGEKVNEKIIDEMQGFLPIRLWASNGVLSGVSPTGVNAIRDAFISGAGFIDFSGHGNTYVYSTHLNNGSAWIPTPTGGFYNYQIAALDNEEKLPIVVTGACSVGKFNQDADCFSWSFLSNPNGGGIASLGATGLGYAYIGEWVTQGLIEGIAIDTFEAYMNGALSFGEMWSDAISDYISWNMDATDYKTIEEWQPFGDPTLAIAEESLPPEKPASPTGPSRGKINEEHTYEAVTTDPEGDDLYYLFDWGNGDFSGWIGPVDSGEPAQTSYTWEKTGDYEIRVKAKDEHGQQSPWSDSIPITMPHRRYIYQWIPDLFEGNIWWQYVVSLLFSVRI